MNPEKEGAILFKGLPPPEIGLLYLFVVSDLLNAAVDDGLSRASLGIRRGFRLRLDQGEAFDSSFRRGRGGEKFESP